MRKDKTLLLVEDVMELLNISSKKKAYEIIRNLNDELTNKGYLIRRGAVSRKYFMERYYMEDKKNDNTAKSRDEKKSHSL